MKQLAIPWAIFPLLSGILFFVIFHHFATRIELTAFDWRAVRTNNLSSATNTLPITNSLSAPSPVVPIPGPLLQAAPTAPAQQRGGFHASGDSSSTGLGFGTNSLPVKNKPADRLTKELNLRMFWAVSAMIFAGLCFVVAAYVIQIIAETLKLKLGGIVLWTGAAVVAFLLLRVSSGGPVLEMAGGAAAEQLLNIMGSEEGHNGAAMAKPLRSEGVPILAHARGLVTFAAAASQLGFISVAVAACCVLMAMRSEQDAFAALVTPSADAITKAKDLYERRVEITVTLLQLTACALVAGVVEVYLLYNMASYYVDPKLLQNDVQSFAQGLATVSGLVYSGLLIAIYLPLVAGQRAIGRELIASHGGNKVNGTDTKFVAQLYDPDPKKAPMIAALLTVFAPVLIALLTKLASSLMDF